MQQPLRFAPVSARPVDSAEYLGDVEVARTSVPSVSRGLPITIRGLRKAFGDNEVLRGIDLHIPAGQFVAIVGRSGCGKSTLLRMLAGFETPDRGRILLGGTDLAALPPHRRPVNMMFQSYALFPHMSVARNIRYGLNGLGISRQETTERMARLLKLVRLEGFEDRKPDKLSGGQRQRVALARALAREPKVLLLDEPLGALDRALREETQGELRALQRRLGTTFIVVTHDPEEAMALADRIGVMDRGRLVQVGSASALYGRPASRFVAGLLGDVNLIEGSLAVGNAGQAFRSVETGFGSIEGAADRLPEAAAAGSAVVLAIRPERLSVDPNADSAGAPGIVTDVTFLGDRVRRQIRMADGTVLRTSAALPGDTGPQASGAAVRVVFPRDAAWLLPA